MIFNSGILYLSMLFEISVGVGAICWLSASIMVAAIFGAMFAPDKPKLISRCVISAILFIPALILVPLGFATCILIFAIAFIIGIAIFGVRIALKLIVDGIPEMDDKGNIVERSSPTAPWV